MYKKYFLFLYFIPIVSLVSSCGFYEKDVIVEKEPYIQYKISYRMSCRNRLNEFVDMYSQRKNYRRFQSNGGLNNDDFNVLLTKADHNIGIMYAKHLGAHLTLRAISSSKPRNSDRAEIEYLNLQIRSICSE